MIRELVEDGWSLVIYPEGGRSPDGWGQDFKAGAAYLSARTGAPVVPVFIDGTGSIFGKGMKRPKPGRTRVVFGAPLPPDRGREHAPLQRPHPGRRDDARRRGDDRLVDGPPPRRRRHQPDARRPRLHRLAPPVGPHDAPPPGHRRLAPPPDPPLARPRLSRRTWPLPDSARRPIAGRIAEISRPDGQPVVAVVAVGGAGAVGRRRQVDRAAGVEVRPVRRARVRRVQLLDRDVELAGDISGAVAAPDLVRRVQRSPPAGFGGVEPVDRRRRPSDPAAVVVVALGSMNLAPGGIRTVPPAPGKFE